MRLRTRANVSEMERTAGHRRPSEEPSPWRIDSGPVTVPPKTYVLWRWDTLRRVGSKHRFQEPIYRRRLERAPMIALALW